jgi:hypothetical protein
MALFTCMIFETLYISNLENTDTLNYVDLPNMYSFHENHIYKTLHLSEMSLRVGKWELK